MKDRKASLDFILLTILIAVCTALFFFIRAAVKAGRIGELLISTPLLIGTYYLEYYAYDKLGYLFPTWVIISPIVVYAIYWIYLLTHEKITSSRANPRWADKNWWWNLDGWQFEEEVAKVYRLNGYKADVTSKTGDDGVDIIMDRDGVRTIVQCKHYREPVPVSCLRELNGVKDDFHADRLIMVASSGLTKAGYDFLGNKPYYTTVDLTDIIRMGLRPKNQRLESYVY